MTTTSGPATTKKPVIFSGIQPSGGGIMLGNYIGALKNWISLQNEGKHDSIFCIVDQHAITVAQDPKELRKKSFELAAIYLASGIDPSKSTLFLQSQVSAHAELAWILGCHTWMGELSRMTQFKDKSEKQKNVGVGLLYYPVLMAADILLYQANLVPVGNDQKQHIELTRDLAIRMNGTYSNASAPLFTIPEPFIPKVGSRIMSLQEPVAKMSKSDPNPNATVFLYDSNDAIMKKMKKAVTDSGTEILYSDDKPGVKNLLMIQSAITGKPVDDIVSHYTGKQYGHLKVETAELVIACVSPIRDEATRLLNDLSTLQKTLKNGADKAHSRASATMNRVKEAIGFIV